MTKTWIAALCLLAGACAAGAQTDSRGVSVPAERARIAHERQQIAQRFDAEEAVCFQKFAVTDCREANRARRRTDLADLQRQEISLNDAERKRKGAEQLQRMEQSRAQESTAPSGSAGKPHIQLRTPATPRPAGNADSQAQQAAAKADAAQTAQMARKATLERKRQANAEEQAARARKAATAPETRARFDAKQQAAADHADSVRQRNAARTKPLAQPLPPPQP